MNNLQRKEFEEISSLLQNSSIYLSIKNLNQKNEKIRLLQDTGKGPVLLAEFYTDQLKYWNTTFKSFCHIFEPMVLSERMIQDQVRTIASLKEQNEARSQMLEDQRRKISALSMESKSRTARLDELESVVEKARDLVKDLEVQRDEAVQKYVDQVAKYYDLTEKYCKLKESKKEVKK